MERGVERALIHLQDVVRNPANALGDGPAVHGLEGNGFQDQEIESALNEVGGFAHAAPLSN
jgi:hypothetical protein